MDKILIGHGHNVICRVCGKEMDSMKHKEYGYIISTPSKETDGVYCEKHWYETFPEDAELNDKNNNTN